MSCWRDRGTSAVITREFFDELFDWPEVKAMSDEEKPDGDIGPVQKVVTEREVRVSVLRPRHEVENKALAAVVHQAGETVYTSDRPVVSVGVVIAWADGTVGTCFDGASYTHLLGALAVLHDRVVHHFERG